MGLVTLPEIERFDKDEIPKRRVAGHPRGDEAKKDGWVVISMKNDGKHIFTFAP